MRWRKLGRVFVPDGSQPWMVAYAANPVAEQLDGDLFRIYFSPRGPQNRAHIGYVDVDLRWPTRVVQVSPEPLLAPGQVGAFDDSGVSLGCLVRIREQKYLYYIGWNLGVSVPWRNSIGLAIEQAPGSKFVRASRAPIVDRSHEDPFSLSYPFVLAEGGRYRMWYGSNLSWGPLEADMRHVIKLAESQDGIGWQRTGHIAINLAEPDEYALARPCVLKDAGLYRMWYSYRGQAYRIGYAESNDGIEWERRDDQAGIQVSETGWDAEMIEYPFVFDHLGQRYMLYNGNGYGKTGFGLAVLE